MFSRLTTLVLLCAAIFGSTVIANAQSGKVQAPTVIRKKKASQAQTPWLVTVRHDVKLAELTASCKEKGITATVLDANRGPDDVVAINITTGLVVDGGGYVLTQLANIAPTCVRPTLTVRTQDNLEFSAEFIGIDGATGLSVLRVPGLAIAAPPTADAIMVGNQSVRTFMPSFQRPTEEPHGGTFDPSTPEPPQLIVNESLLANTSENVMKPAVPIEPNCGIAMDQQNRIIGVVQPNDGRGKLFRFLPISTVKKALSRIIAAGKSIPRGWLGIDAKSLTSIPSNERSKLRIRSNKGVMVTAVAPQSPAEAAGLLTSDIIVAVENKPIDSRRGLTDNVAARAAGDQMRVTVERNGQQQEILITLGSKEDAPVTEGETQLLPEQLALGLVTSEMTPQLAEYLGAPAGGVMIVHVTPESSAAQAGLKAGDIIISANGQPTPQRDGLSLAIFATPPPIVKLEVVRDRKTIQLELPVPTAPVPNPRP